MIPCITLPTRITSHSANLIDHMHVYLPGKNILTQTSNGNLLFEIADHLPTFSLLHGEPPPPKSRPKGDAFLRKTWQILRLSLQM